MKIDNRTECCGTCKYWLAWGINRLVGKIEVDSPMQKSRCQCKYNMEGKHYYTQPLNKCNFYEQTWRLIWYDGDNPISRIKKQ